MVFKGILKSLKGSKTIEDKIDYDKLQNNVHSFLKKEIYPESSINNENNEKMPFIYELVKNSPPENYKNPVPTPISNNYNS